jgi:hypothetical protein
VVPFTGLTIATAPVIAHYLTILRPIANSNGFGAGVAESLVPAIGLPPMFGSAVFAIGREYELQLR